MINNELLGAIQFAIWGKGQASVDQHVFDEIKKHTITSLFAPCLSNCELPAELKEKWKRSILQQVSYYTHYKYEQSHLPITVPYVILKGSSAAQYYPNPEYRSMGDIDIMTHREDYDIACKQLIENGYQVINDIYKETSLIKNGISIDLHRQFASLNNPDYVKYLDDLIIQNINPSHVLPDPINGLVLLEHINQHLEDGIGLRQIIDWMMFVDKCLPDEKWPEFYELVKNIGLEKLAVVSTRMCELYLGLPTRKWSASAEIDQCAQLMEYVLACGNFGNKKNSDADISETAFTYTRTPKAWFRLLQKQGLINWKLAQKYKIFKPFAWIYQLIRYASRGLKRDQALYKIKEEYVSAKKKMALFDALGVKTASKGIVVYKNGKYVKE